MDAIDTEKENMTTYTYEIYATVEITAATIEQAEEKIAAIQNRLEPYIGVADVEMVDEQPMEVEEDNE